MTYYIRIKTYIENIKWIRFLFTYKKEIILFIVFLFPAGAYFWKFGGNGLGDTEQWALFGDYIGGVYSVLMALVVIFISQKIEINKSRNEKKRKLAEDIFNQIATIKQRYNANSINKLIRLANQSKLYFTPYDSSMIEELGNHFLRVNNNDEELNEELVTRVEKRMKGVYG